jgi:hypothetical protein
MTPTAPPVSVMRDPPVQIRKRRPPECSAHTGHRNRLQPDSHVEGHIAVLPVTFSVRSEEWEELPDRSFSAIWMVTRFSPLMNDLVSFGTILFQGNTFYPTHRMGPIASIHGSWPFRDTIQIITFHFHCYIT